MFVEAIRTIGILLLIIFGIWTIFLIYRSVRIYPKAKRLYKSSFNSVWKSLTASITIIVFFAISFSIISGTISSIDRLSESVNSLTINSNLHQGFIETDTIKFRNSNFKIDNEETKEQDSESLDYLLNYYDNNLAIPILLAYLYVVKGISNATFDDTFKNIKWKYELSYFVTRENVSWGYKYISLNDHRMLSMLYDFTRGELKSIDQYRVEAYDQELFGQSNVNNLKTSKKIINDYQVIDSLRNDGVNTILDYSKSSDYDVVVGIGADWADKNDHGVGDIISLPQENGTNIDAKIGFTFRSPEYMYPSFTLSKVIPDASEQTYVVMNSEDYLKYFSGITDSKISIGFDNLYKDINTWQDYNSGFINKRLKEYINRVNTQLFVLFQDVRLYRYNDIKNYNSIGVAAVFLQLQIMILVSIALLIIFLLITLSIMIVLIKKRVALNRKELGTLKSQGWSYTNIALSFISYSLFIIIAGGILAFILGFFVQGIWVSSWSRSFLIGYGNPIVSFSSLIVIFVIPILLLFSISYFITRGVLKKPAIELINNIQYNKPNILVRAYSKISHRFKSFYFTYQTKNVLKSMGKSTVLFIAIFLSVILSSLSLSIINLINKTVVEAVDTVSFENVISLDQNAQDSTPININDEDFESKYSNYYMFQSTIAYNQVENKSEEQVIELAQNEINFIGNTTQERLIGFDILFGNYVNNVTFDSTNTIIPWQAFTILQVGIDEVLKDSTSVGNWGDQVLPISKISFNDYRNLLFTYQDYVNINNDISEENDEELILPNIGFNTIYYDNINIFPYYITNVTNSNYIDSNTNEEITSLFDLSFEKTNQFTQEKVVVLNDEEFILRDDMPYVSVEQYLNDLEEYDFDIDSTEPYLVSYYQENSRTPYEDELYEETYDVTFLKYQRSGYTKDTSYNGQWLSIFNTTDNVSSTIRFDTSKIENLNNYESKNIETVTIDKLTGEETTEIVKSIPIAIDTFNAERLNLEEGQIIETSYYDLENELNNDLELNGVDGGVAFEIVDIFEYSLPIGAITLSEYIFDAYVSNIEINTLIQSISKQQSYYSLTSSRYEDGTTLNDDIDNTRKIYQNVISKSVFTDQINVITSSFIFIIIVFIFFILLIAITLIIISIKEIIDSSVNEISILKANGVRNGKAIRLILIPYILIMMIGLIIGAALNVVFLYYMSLFLSKGIGLFHINLQLYLWQWGVIFGINILMFIIMWISSYRTLARRNTIDEL